MEDTIATLRRVTRNAHLWLPGYLRSRWSRRGLGPPSDVWVTIADHFEPCWGRPEAAVARQRVARWRREWPEIAQRHRDSSDRRPCYTFFYPQEEYHPDLLDPLAEMAGQGIADVEVHIHHDGDGEESFLRRMRGFIETLHLGHGLLRRHRGQIAFGFIHGNWALDNSRPDGRWCGLNNEITLLRDLGCYADFTLPSAPDACQTGPVNVVYQVRDDPARPRSHARGSAIVPGGPSVGDLTLIPGPLGLLWSKGRRGKPRLDTGEIAGQFLPSAERVRLWIDVAPRVGSHSFIKLFTHGAQEKNAAPLLEGGLDRLFEAFRSECAQRQARLHYVSAWEMWQAVEAARRSDQGSRK
ncbi:MAG TPA: hypothetical protein VGQ33_02915 [Vicinamibacteria bacterium]|nr:hypothetical protein [Vicinamibacteria bacterium]